MMAKRPSSPVRPSGRKKSGRGKRLAAAKAKTPGKAKRATAKSLPKRPAAGHRPAPKKRPAAVRGGTKRVPANKGLRAVDLADWAEEFQASLADSAGTGFAVLLLAGCGGGGRADVVQVCKSVQASGKPGESDELRWSKIARRIAPNANRQDQLAGLLAVLGHRQRLTILFKLLEGPATYAGLQKTTSMKAGPLYHHIAQLRLAGCIGPKHRDVYALTDRGRQLAWMLRGLTELIASRK